MLPCAGPDARVAGAAGKRLGVARQAEGLVELGARLVSEIFATADEWTTLRPYGVGSFAAIAVRPADARGALDRKAVAFSIGPATEADACRAR